MPDTPLVDLVDTRTNTRLTGPRQFVDIYPHIELADSQVEADQHAEAVEEAPVPDTTWTRAEIDEYATGTAGMTPDEAASYPTKADLIAALTTPQEA